MELCSRRGTLAVGVRLQDRSERTDPAGLASAAARGDRLVGWGGPCAVRARRGRSPGWAMGIPRRVRCLRGGLGGRRGGPALRNGARRPAVDDVVRLVLRRHRRDRSPSGAALCRARHCAGGTGAGAARSGLHREAGRRAQQRPQGRHCSRRLSPDRAADTLLKSPVRFVFGLHLHRPVGNFDQVMADHVRDVYRPIIERTSAAGFFPLTLHVSGPLLEWLEQHDTAWLDMIGRLAADGRLELLLAGFDEPILASLPRPDRLEQIGRMREFLKRRFGVQASGLWLTERVWHPELAADLAEAGVEYALVDDRHFLVSGFQHDELHKPHHTESDGRRVGLLAIDERLRYMIPFRPPEETASYLRQLRSEGHGLAILADDGEKFGGWPGTKDWVYGSGWLDTFLRTMEKLTSAGEIQLSTGQEAFRQVASGGLAYLGTASYREMEKWALPPKAQRDLTTLEEELGPKDLAASASFVRGGHWHHFLVKYPESNRMHKTMLALSTLSRTRGDPPEARRAIGRAQCNDAYWHGVFGGLYLPHLRNAIWRQLAIAERVLRQGESLAYEELDLDYDGYAELWSHSAQFSAVISPHRGGAIETFTRFNDLTNLADVLT